MGTWASRGMRQCEVVTSAARSSSDSDKRLIQTLNLGYCPLPVTVYIRGPIKGYI